MNEKKIVLEIESINVEDLSVENLEQRLELSFASDPTPDGAWCDCNGFTIG